MGIFKQVYRGHAIYWHGEYGYGDETIASVKTMAEMKAKIDANIKLDDDNRPDHLKYWDTLPHNERGRWRRLCATSDLSASELAYNHSIKETDNA